MKYTIIVTSEAESYASFGKQLS